jgi:hypothetical protein
LLTSSLRIAAKIAKLPDLLGARTARAQQLRHLGDVHGNPPRFNS